MSGGNGNKLLYTIMGFLFVAMLTVVGWARDDVYSRVKKAEDTRDLVIELKAEVSLLRSQVARIERKVDDLRRGEDGIHIAAPDDYP